MNFTSNSKIFIDFGATPASPVGGAIWLQAITSFKVTDQRSSEIKKAIGVRGGAGKIRKQGGGMIAMTETRQNKPQVDWRELLRNEKEFMVMVQDENNGPREKWFGVSVSKVDRSSTDEGEHTDEIELTFLRSV